MLIKRVRSQGVWVYLEFACAGSGGKHGVRRRGTAQLGSWEYLRTAVLLILRQPNQRNWCFFSSIMWLNGVWTLTLKAWTVVNCWINKKHSGIHFCEKNKIVHINLRSISWAWKWIKYVKHFIKPVLSESCHLAQHPFVASKLLFHHKKEMTLGIMIWSPPPPSNE